MLDSVPSCLGVDLNRGAHLSAFLATLLISLAVLASPPNATASDAEAQFEAVADTTITELSPDATLGDSATLLLSSTPSSSGLIQFEVAGIPEGAVVTAATLSLDVTPSGAASGAVHLAEGTWDEDTTWSSAPQLGERLGTSAAAGHDGRVEMDVSDGVTGNGPVAFYLVLHQGDDVLVRSSESGRGPLLRVTWTEMANPDATIQDPVIEPDIEPVPDADINPDPFDIVVPETVTPDTGGISALAAVSGSSDTLYPTADASIDSRARSTNRGENTRLDVDGSPLMRTLLRFDASDIPDGTSITSARLRLYTLDSSGNAGAVHEVSGSWSEGSVTWSNAPSPGDRIVNIGAVRSGSWASIDLTRAVESGDSVDLYLVSSAENGAEFASSESQHAPQLIVEWGGSGGAAPSPTPVAAPKPTSGCPDIPSSRHSLLNEREGFGRDVTGGASGCLYTVTNNNDDGPGSLRWAAERGGYWIVFGGNFTIRLDGPINVAANTTIDGRDRQVTLERGGLYLLHENSSNVILSHLTIRSSTSGEDLVEVRNGASRFWLNHLTLRDSSDEYIDIGNAPPSGIRGTISWCRFERVDGYEMVFIIGDQNGAQHNDEIWITAHHNYYQGTNSRHPLITGAKLHSYNNVYQWLRWGIQVRASERPSEVVSDRDIFDGAGSRQPGQGIYFQGGTNHVRVTGALYLNGGGIQNPSKYGNPASAFKPPYGYGAETATQSLFNRVTSGAGNR